MSEAELKAEIEKLKAEKEEYRQIAKELINSSEQKIKAKNEVYNQLRKECDELHRALKVANGALIEAVEAINKTNKRSKPNSLPDSVKF